MIKRFPRENSDFPIIMCNEFTALSKWKVDVELQVEIYYQHDHRVRN